MFYNSRTLFNNELKQEYFWSVGSRSIVEVRETCTVFFSKVEIRIRFQLSLAQTTLQINGHMR